MFIKHSSRKCVFFDSSHSAHTEMHTAVDTGERLPACRTTSVALQQNAAYSKNFIRLDGV